MRAWGSARWRGRAEELRWARACCRHAVFPQPLTHAAADLLLLGAIGLPGLPLAGGFAYLCVPWRAAPLLPHRPPLITLLTRASPTQLRPSLVRACRVPRPVAAHDPVPEERLACCVHSAHPVPGPAPRPASSPAPSVSSAGGGGGGQAAKDALGDIVKSKKWLSTHQPGARELTQGLKARPPPGPRVLRGRRAAAVGGREGVARVATSGWARGSSSAGALAAAPRRPAPGSRLPVVQGDATYLIVKNDGTLADYGLNAVCTHLGCVVPWNSARRPFPPDGSSPLTVPPG